MPYSVAGEVSDEDRRLLVELDESRALNPLWFYNHPVLSSRPVHGRQLEFHSLRVPVKAFLGGNRSGKTTAGIVDDLIQAVDVEVLPDHLRGFKRFTPPFHCRVIAPDFTETMEGVIFEKFREWCPRSQFRGGSWGKAFDKVRRRLWFANGSWFSFMTFEQDLDKFGGAALHRVHYDEEPPELIRNESMMRLTDYGGDEIFTMTPLLGMSWMFKQIYQPWEKGKSEDTAIVVVDMDDNPWLDEAAKGRVLARYSAGERLARKSGRFVHFAGLVFDEFDEARHRVPEPDPSELPEVPVFCGIDPGIRHMAAVVWCYLDYEDRLVVFDELAARGDTIAEVCRQIHLRNARWGRTPVWYVIDPAARNKNQQTGRSDQMEYARHDLPVFPGQNSVTAGIHRVRERLETDRLLVAGNCTELMDEFQTYRWATPPRSENDAREKPIKRDDHLLDALRYVCMQLFGHPEREEPDDTPKFERWIKEDIERQEGPAHEFGAVLA